MRLPPAPDPLLLPRGEQQDRVVRELRRGKLVPDAVFDRIYPERIRLLSAQHWTPLKVARRAAALLVTEPGTRVLDVGAGAGKFCLVGALTSKGHFTGIEQRAPLVELAQAVAAQYGVGRVRYLHGDMRTLDWSGFGGVYLFNPFAENCFGVHEHIDDAVVLTRERFEQDVAVVRDKLAEAPPGMRVVTWYGFGAELPAGYSRRVREPASTGVLELWVRDED